MEISLSNLDAASVAMSIEGNRDDILSLILWLDANIGDTSFTIDLIKSLVIDLMDDLSIEEIKEQLDGVGL